MGHMWQRWGSPDLADFAAALSVDPALGNIDAIGDAVGRGSGIVHGAKAITKLADAMCAPDDGIEFVFDGNTSPGAGDLFLERVDGDELLKDQHDALYGCSASSMREVYLASAQSFGAVGPSETPPADLARCFTQRATNRAVGLGAAIQIPIALTAALPSVAVIPIARSSDAYLVSLGLSSGGRSDFYVPLTSEILTRVNLFGVLFAQSVVPRWQEDMRRIQERLSFRASLDPSGTTLADGALGPLLGMEPNAAYTNKAATSSYAEPPLPWTPTATDVPLTPRVENAANILARTFVDAHVQDWCEVLHEEGDDEFALDNLRERCAELRETDDEDADIACDVCSRFAEWFVYDADPDVAANPSLADAPLCTLVAGVGGIETQSAAGDFDRAQLATRYCEAGPDLELTGTIETEYSLHYVVAPVEGLVVGGESFHTLFSSLSFTRKLPGGGGEPSQFALERDIIYDTRSTDNNGVPYNELYQSVDDLLCAEIGPADSDGFTLEGPTDEAARADPATFFLVLSLRRNSQDFCMQSSTSFGVDQYWEDYHEYLALGYFFDTPLRLDGWTANRDGGLDLELVLHEEFIDPPEPDRSYEEIVTTTIRAHIGPAEQAH